MKKQDVQPKPKTPKEFADAYSKLCEEYGYRIVTTPVWLSRDDGTFSMQIQISVGKLPEKKDN